MARRRYRPQERIGISAVGHIVAEKMRWIWREQPVADFGIDAHIEAVGEDGRPTGKLFAVQVKSGASYFRGGKHAVSFYVDDEHIRYWDQHALPAILVLHNPEDGATIWQWANLTAAKPTAKGWRIDLPRAKVLGKASKAELHDQVRQDDSLGLRRRFALDRQFMEKFENRDAFVSIDAWVNKHLKFREIGIVFDEPYGKADYQIPIMATWGYEAGDIVRHFLPWLDFEYFEEPDASSGEVEGHLFSVQLSAAAKGFLAAERFFDRPPSPHGDDREGSDDEDLINERRADEGPEDKA